MAGTGGKSKKPGRNKVTSSHYKAQFRREKNKIKKVQRHLKRYGDDDKVAVECIKMLRIKLGIK